MDGIVGGRPDAAVICDVEKASGVVAHVVRVAVNRDIAERRRGPGLASVRRSHVADSTRQNRVRVGGMDDERVVVSGLRREIEVEASGLRQARVGP